MSHEQSPLPTVEVVPGCIRVASVTMFIDTPQAKVLYVDLHTKRCEVTTLWYGGPDGEGSELRLAKAEDTLYEDDTTSSPTRIKISGIGHDWHAEAYGSRYSVYVFLWKVPYGTEGVVLWSDKVGGTVNGRMGRRR